MKEYKYNIRCKFCGKLFPPRKCIIYNYYKCKDCVNKKDIMINPFLKK